MTLYRHRQMLKAKTGSGCKYLISCLNKSNLEPSALLKGCSLYALFLSTTAMLNSSKLEKLRFLNWAIMKVQQSPAAFSALGLSLGFLILAGIIAAW